MTRAVDLANSVANGVSLGFKNRIINGAMMIWQRGTSFSGGYTADRWEIAGTSMTAARSTDVPSTAFQYSMSFTGSNNAHIKQKIESNNCYDLVGQTITISFWAKQTVGAGANGIGIDLYTPNATDNYAAVTLIASTSVTTTNAWAYYSVTFSNLAASVARGLQPLIYFPNAASQTVLFTGFQLEVGSTATNFEYRDYGRELMMCQRYFEKSYDIDVVPGTSANNAGANTTLTLQFGVSWDVKYKATKRAAATITTYSPFNGATGNFSVNMSSNAAVTGVLSNGLSGFSPYTGTSPGNVVNYIHWTASAEL
jgi:hypothetical protein